MKLNSWLILSIFLAPSAMAAPSVLYTQAKQLLDAKDYLGLRIYVKNAYAKKMSQGEWYSLKNMITSSADHIGYDLIPYWNARNSKGQAAEDKLLIQVDQLMAGGKYEQAFVQAQTVAQKMKAWQKTRWDAAQQLPYIYHSMARALYGAGRYDDALRVYQWVSQKYPYFNQILFEKMWAAFKSGRVDLALGAIASQRSAYFSKYLQPESYLVQTYLYRKLCRDEDQKQVVQEMKDYEAVLANPQAELPVVTDVNTLVLSQIAQQSASGNELFNLIPKASRDREQEEIKLGLKKSVERQRPKILADLKTVIAYQELSSQPDSKSVLKPVEKLKSRDDMLKLNLEVWPTESSEEFMDEIGKHVLIGESLCKPEK